MKMIKIRNKIINNKSNINKYYNSKRNNINK